MKRTVLALVLTSVVFQGAGIAQSPAEDKTQPPAWAGKRMGIHAENAPVLELLGVVQQAGRFTLRMDEDARTLLGSERITMHVKSEPIGTILSTLLETGKLTYRVIDEKAVQVVRQ